MAIDWQQLSLDPGIQREPSHDRDRFIVWLSATDDDGVRVWQRVSNVPGAEVIVVDGVTATAATAIRARPPGGGLFGRLLRKLRCSSDAVTWILPSGSSGEQVGERQTDLLLAWSEAANGPLTEEAIAARWPGASRRQRLGAHVFLIAGIEQSRPQDSPAPHIPRVLPPALAPSAPGATPREQAEKLLAVVRQAGDRRREAAVLADLGVACQRGGDAKSAVPHLEAALLLANEFGDQALASDVLGSLGLATAVLGQPARGVELVEQGLATARASGNQYQIKTALDNIGQVYAAARAPRRALAALDEALSIARTLGDRPHQADLLWCIAIQHGDLDEREPALARAQEAIALYQQLGSPHVALLNDHLQQFAAGAEGARLPTTGDIGAVVGGWQGPAAAGPSFLRMAYTAVKSMAKFVGSGMKTVTPAVRDERLRTCGSCEHHTGVRCRLCGCFTAVKTWLPHEHCPVEKWPK